MTKKLCAKFRLTYDGKNLKINTKTSTAFKAEVKSDVETLNIPTA